MKMSPRIRKFALTVHVASSVGSLGAVAAFLSLALAGLASGSERVQQGVYVAMALITWWVIMPSVAVALLTGLIQSLGTRWGLFRHYWVLVKFLLTCLVIVVLLLQAEAIDAIAELSGAAVFSGGELFEIRLSLALHAGGGLLVLLIVEALSIYKPPGLTRYGRRMRADMGD